MSPCSCSVVTSAASARAAGCTPSVSTRGAACTTGSSRSTVGSSPPPDKGPIQPVALLVSIHDVTPALAPQVETLWTLCRARGVTPALLVVPNWHGDWPLERYPAFVQWIRSCAA